VYETCDSERVYEYGGEFYESARQLLKEIHGRSYHHTFEQYFRLEDVSLDRGKPSIFDVLGLKSGSGSVGGGSRSKKLTSESFGVGRNASFGVRADIRGGKGRSKQGGKADETLVRGLAETFSEDYEDIRKARALTALATSPRDGKGIDLAGRGHEVRKLLFAGFRGMMAAKSYDPEDVLQEIYKGLLTRNAGKCPWDGEKSTFGYYVTMVCRCVLTNYHRKMSRRMDREHVELNESLYGSGGMAGGSEEMAHEALVRWLREGEHGGGSVEGELAVKVMPLLAAGCTRKEIVGQLGVSENSVAKATAHLRKWSREWAEEIGVVLRK